MVFNLIFKVLCLSLIFTIVVADSGSVNECDEINAFFENREDRIITITDCEVDENGTLSLLEVIQADNYDLPEEELLKILSYDQVHTLILSGFTINQTIIDSVAKMPNLKKFTTLYSSFEDSSLDYTPLKSLNGQLDILEFVYNYFDGNIFKKIKFLNELPRLKYFEINISKDHIKAISKFPNLKDLFLVSAYGFTDDISFNSLKDLKKLETLGIVLYGSKLKNNMLSVLKQVKNLYLEEIDFSQANIKELSGLTNLEELKIRYNDFPETLNFDPLKKLKNLKNLEIYDTRDDQKKFNEIPEFIYSLTNLKRLVFKNQNIQAIPEKLSKLTNLEYIDLVDNNINAELPESLNALSNLTYIDLRGNRNLTGKVLSNEKLESCFYEGNYSLCKDKPMTCLENSGIDFTRCIPDDEVSTDGQCGKNHGRCPSGKCCSKYGWCGTGESFCSASLGCQSEFGDCNNGNSNTNPDPNPSEIKCGKKYGKCPNGQCCSKDGKCGKSDDFCSIEKGCQTKFGSCIAEVPISTDGRCGVGKGRCPSGNCCSKHGWCGTSEAHCSASLGCQSEFGKCV